MLYGLVLNNWSLVPVKLQEVDRNRFHTSCVSLPPTISETDLKGQMTL